MDTPFCSRLAGCELFNVLSGFLSAAAYRPVTLYGEAFPAVSEKELGGHEKTLGFSFRIFDSGGAPALPEQGCGF
ncbi:hypothetical protein DWY99_06225 [[Clostridium] leptum]|uniref:Uncharacterized protein n=1 Tax=[Clostridium] leptum TaxID=1535 RepID=A0A412AXN7_9FIRM|nr:hypothetical protein DWY99_06225 [[Clostridium] leptum]